MVMNPELWVEDIVLALGNVKQRGSELRSSRATQGWQDVFTPWSSSWDLQQLIAHHPAP